MINIVVANWNSYDFLYLLIESWQRFSSIQSELIVIDNSEDRFKVDEPNVYQFFMQKNIGHGRALNHGVAKALEMFPENQFYLFLDVDCHFLCYNWEEKLIRETESFDLIGGKGSISKPIRPAFMFMKKDLCTYDWSATEGYQGNRVTPGGYDVAIKAYYKIMLEGYKINLIEPKKSRYKTLNGEEYQIKENPIIYHHWSGTWLEKRQEEFPENNLLDDKKHLFNNIFWRNI